MSPTEILGYISVEDFKKHQEAIEDSLSKKLISKEFDGINFQQMDEEKLIKIRGWKW